ncbi:hypothetical protein VNO77_44666 [Canavalia gladiata]|uniref:Uncharacterized protein n=1 Tax=Canavalia gladiata TaxID=3824 RepID=A0AAN9PQJ0_CANGL
MGWMMADFISEPFYRELTLEILTFLICYPLKDETSMHIIHCHLKACWFQETFANFNITLIPPPSEIFAKNDNIRVILRIQLFLIYAVVKGIRVDPGLFIIMILKKGGKIRNSAWHFMHALGGGFVQAFRNSESSRLCPLRSFTLAQQRDKDTLNMNITKDMGVAASTRLNGSPPLHEESDINGLILADA